MRSFSIWLIPEDVKVYRSFAEKIDRISRQFGSLSFEPHITLLGGIKDDDLKKVSLKIEQLAQSLKPFKLSATTVHTGTDFYKGLFVAVPETSELKIAYGRAQAVFGKRQETYEPHLSLAYGNFPDIIKQRIQDVVGNAIHQNFLISGLHLVSFSDEGTFSKWTRVKEFPFAAVADTVTV